MRILSVIILLLAIFIFYALFAGDHLYTLESENSSYQNVLTWLPPMQLTDGPIPVRTDRILFQKENVPLENSDFFYTQGSPYVGIIRRKIDRRQSQATIDWYDLTGRAVGRYVHNLNYDQAFPAYFLDPADGKLIIVDIFNHVSVVSPDGQVLNHFTLTDDYAYHNENNLAVQLINGNLYSGMTDVIVTEDGPVQYENLIQITSLEGEPLMSYDLQDWRMLALDVSDDGRYIAASTYRRESEQNIFRFQTFIIDSRGNLKQRIQVRFRQACFNRSNSLLCLMDRKKALLYDLRSGSMLNEIITGDEKSMFLAAKFLGDSDLLTLLEGQQVKNVADNRHPWIYQNLLMTTLDQRGQEAEQLSLKAATIYQPAFWYDAQSKILFFGHNNGWKKFSVSF